ncbi:MAG: T9SS type A sorting domain-containing protein [Ignavibacteria bacterium]|nr:T9SS type A sorting domain-containing protein [Ignavibacteria bacterium]
MKKLIRIFIFIAVYYVMNIGERIELKAQNFQCAPAQTNTIIPNNSANLNLSENSVAVHPLNAKIVLSANNINLPGGVSAHVSVDWGVTWNPQTYNILPGSGFDPTAMIDLQGNLYVSYLGNGGVSVARSTDLGNNWSSFPLPNSSGADKPHSKVDNSCTSPYSGRIYCAWDYSSILFTYSTNQGANWITPISLPGSSPGHGVNITTDNSGNVYVMWPIHGREPTPYNALRFTKSSDGGDTWSPHVTINLQYSVTKSYSGWPSMSVNLQDGTLYLVYSGNTNGSPNFYDVFLKKSYDGGSTWSTESPINQVRTNDQVFPWISCDPISGHLACIYYDTREGAPSVKHAFVSISTNAGMNWCDMRVSTEGVGLATGDGSHYIGIEINKGIVYPIWTKSDINSTYRTIVYPFDVIPKDLNVQNQVYYGYNIIQSAKSISSSDVTIAIGSNTVFRSSESITLNPGFTMGKSSTFIAELYSCENLGIENTFAIDYYKNINRQDNETPLEYSLSQNYPNPFNPVTKINYTLKNDSKVTLTIYNILGQLVKEIVDSFESKGLKEVLWNGTNEFGNQVSSGVYFYKLTAGDFVDQKKLVIIR